MQANLYAVKYIGSSLASSVSAIYPAVSVILAFFFLKHKVSKNTVFGILLIIVGIIAQTYKVEQVNSFLYRNPLRLDLCACLGEVKVFSAHLLWKVNSVNSKHS